MYLKGLIRFICILLAVYFVIGAFYISFPIESNTGSTDRFKATGTVGDTFGQVISLLGVIAALFAFFAQLQANKSQNKNFAIQQFEAHFFELLRLHKDNTELIEFNGVKGKLAFIDLNDVFDGAFHDVQHAIFSHNISITEEQMIDLAYQFLYFGLSSNVPFSTFESYTYSKLMEVNVVTSEEVYSEIYSDYIKSIKYKFGKKKEESSSDYQEVPQECHSGLQSVFSPYFSHLLHTIKYIDTRYFLTSDQKILYVTTLRNQVSPHEQVMLFHHAISSLGKDWHSIEFKEKMFFDKENSLIAKYELVKKMIIDYRSFYERKLPEKYYPSIEFENKYDKPYGL